MRWSRVCIESVAYQLPYERVSTRALEDRLAPAYDALGLGPGQLEALTGVRERHYWPPGTSLPAVAAQAAERALQRAGLPAAELGAVVYAGVSRDRLEPAIACAVAAILGTPPDAWLFDLSAGCLSALLAVVDLANRIELGQIRTALVVAAESARETVDETVRHLNANPSLDAFRLAVSTLGAGSAAAAIVLSDASVSRTGRRLLGGASVTAPEQHGLRFLGSEQGLLGQAPLRARTDSSAILVHGVHLGVRAFERFFTELRWHPDDVDRLVCHQVGSGGRPPVLDALGIPPEKGFSTVESHGDTGAVALLMGLAMAEEQALLPEGDRVALLGIGSGLSSIMLGITW